MSSAKYLECFEFRFMIDFLQLLIVGISQGCVYGLIALGFVLIYKATEMVNFAQGEMMVVGSFIAWTFIVSLGFNFWIGLLAAMMTMAVFGFLLDAAVVRRIIGQPQFSVVILTIGIGIILRAGSGMVWGNQPLTMPTPFPGNSEFFGAVIGNERLAIIGTTVLLIGGLVLFFRYSRWGVALMASSQNQLAALYLGIPVRFIFSAVWAGAAVVSTIAGTMLAPITLIEPLNSFLGIKAFAAAVIGGFNSITGAIVGGVIIGLVEAFTGAYLPVAKETIGYIIMFAVLMAWPGGLFGRAYRKKV